MTSFLFSTLLSYPYTRILFGGGLLGLNALALFFFLRRAKEKTACLTERVENLEKRNQALAKMLKASADRPANLEDLKKRFLDSRF